MISRKKILSCSQNDLSCDSGYDQTEEDVWYQKKTLYKVRISINYSPKDYFAQGNTNFYPKNNFKEYYFLKFCLKWTQIQFLSKTLFSLFVFENIPNKFHKVITLDVFILYILGVHLRVYSNLLEQCKFEGHFV